MAKIKLIAEIGWNHLGDMSVAKRMIEAAAHSGADYVKFQTWRVANLKPGPWDSDGRRKIYESAELSEEDHKYLKDVCNGNNVKFLTSIFCRDDITFVRSICDEVKIPSPESAQTHLVSECIKKFDHVYVSTGASYPIEYMRWANFDNVTLMHCVSAYPCDIGNVNFPKFDFLKTLTPRVGYSGHLSNFNDAFAAVCRGATAIEKHFTIDRQLPGRDNMYALLPDEFSQIRKFIDQYGHMNTNRGFEIQGCEEQYRKFHKGRWDKYEEEIIYIGQAGVDERSDDPMFPI